MQYMVLIVGIDGRERVLSVAGAVSEDAAQSMVEEVISDADKAPSPFMVVVLDTTTQEVVFSWGSIELLEMN